MNTSIAKILAIETSCDETAIAILGFNGVDIANATVLGNSIASQANLHAQFGGVYPSLAKREHAKNIVPVLIDALTQAGINTNTKLNLNDEQKTFLQELFKHEPELYEIFINHVPQINSNEFMSIGVTTGPGLAPALWVGVNFANALSYVWSINTIAINHMEGHILSPLIKNNYKLPALALLISGGHTEIVHVQNLGHYKKIGQTVDDAVGEAYDKVARLLGLPYPGGPQIANLAQIDRNNNQTATINLPKPMLHSGDLNMSFSGLKTAVLYMVQKLTQNQKENAQEVNLSDELKQNIARAFEDSVTQVLVSKTMQAIKNNNIETVLVGGGVSANNHIKNELIKTINNFNQNITVLFPEANLATDNAIMIGLATILKTNQNKLDQTKSSEGLLTAQSNWEL